LHSVSSSAEANRDGRGVGCSLSLHRVFPWRHWQLCLLQHRTPALSLCDKRCRSNPLLQPKAEPDGHPGFLPTSRLTGANEAGCLSSSLPCAILHNTRSAKLGLVLAMIVPAVVQIDTQSEADGPPGRTAFDWAFKTNCARPGKSCPTRRPEGIA